MSSQVISLSARVPFHLRAAFPVSEVAPGLGAPGLKGVSCGEIWGLVAVVLVVVAATPAVGVAVVGGVVVVTTKISKLIRKIH